MSPTLLSTRAALPLLLVTLATACGEPAKGPGNQIPGRALETGKPNAPEQQPGFVGQTRAPYKTTNVAFDVRVVARELEHPWAVAFLPDARMLVSERPGRLRLVAVDGTKSEALGGVPQVLAEGQGGLLDVVVSPTPEDSRYFTCRPRQGGSGTAAPPWQLVLAGRPSRGREGLWRMTPRSTRRSTSARASSSRRMATSSSPRRALEN